MLISLLMAAGFIPNAWAVSPQSEAKGSAPTPRSPKKTSLSDEEKEILKFRELLENLELLQNLESVKYMDFLTERSEKKSQQKVVKKAGAGDHESKKSN